MFERSSIRDVLFEERGEEGAARQRGQMAGAVQENDSDQSGGQAEQQKDAEDDHALSKGRGVVVHIQVDGFKVAAVAIGWTAQVQLANATAWLSFVPEKVRFPFSF